LLFIYFLAVVFLWELTGVADTGVVNLDAHLVSAGRSNLDILNGEGLSRSPGDGGL
jgi:hypothetical protein